MKCLDCGSSVFLAHNVHPDADDHTPRVAVKSAEPRWPSGPDARYLDLDDPATVERVARALQWMLFGATDISDNDLVDAKDLIAALQEKRDPGE